ncbi:MAG: hypothetical protein ACE5MI_03245 [Acidimicrobiia bacterium]
MSDAAESQPASDEAEPGPGPPAQSAPDEGVSFLGIQATDRVELLSTIILAVAAVLTAWSAFQSAKWSGVMSIDFNSAGTARTESTRFDTLAGQQAQVDVGLFTNWLAALNDDLNAGAISVEPGQGYQPTPGTLSGFLFERFRPEFRPAMDAWLALEPVTNPEAPKSPFEMPEYQLEAAQEADRLQALADEHRSAALVANQTSDDYVLTAVLFASVLFFAGVSTKMQRPRNRKIMVGVATVFLVVGTVIVVSLPVELGDLFGTL